MKTGKLYYSFFNKKIYFLINIPNEITTTDYYTCTMIGDPTGETIKLPGYEVRHFWKEFEDRFLKWARYD